MGCLMIVALASGPSPWITANNQPSVWGERPLTLSLFYRTCLTQESYDLFFVCFGSLYLHDSPHYTNFIEQSGAQLEIWNYDFLPEHRKPWAMRPHMKLAQYSHQCGPRNVCICRSRQDGHGETKEMNMSVHGHCRPTTGVRSVTIRSASGGIRGAVVQSREVMFFKSRLWAWGYFSLLTETWDRNNLS